MGKAYGNAHALAWEIKQLSEYVKLKEIRNQLDENPTRFSRMVRWCCR